MKHSAKTYRSFCSASFQKQKGIFSCFPSTKEHLWLLHKRFSKFTAPSIHSLYVPSPAPKCVILQIKGSFKVSAITSGAIIPLKARIVSRTPSLLPFSMPCSIPFARPCSIPCSKPFAIPCSKPSSIPLRYPVPDLGQSLVPSLLLWQPDKRLPYSIRCITYSAPRSHVFLKIRT